MRFGVLALGTMLCLCSVLAQAEVYRWTDADGITHYSDTPPKDAESKAPKLYDNRISTETTPYEVKKAAQNFPLTLYVDTACQDACSQARKWLQQRKAPFSEKVLKTAEDVAALNAQVGKTANMVPSLTLGSKLLEGFDPNAWSVALDAAGYPK